MEAQFWIKAWKEGRTNFNQKHFNEKLLEFFPKLNPKAGQKVLVPLCGKSIDLIYLGELGLQVHGVELFEQAVEDFFTENALSGVRKTQNKDFSDYTFENLRLSVGDFFKLDQDRSYDLVYDRASLVALPPEMRKSYSEVIKGSLKVGGKCLLIAYEYDQTKRNGPPFSVEQLEVQALYQDQFTIQLLERSDAAIEGFKETVYLLEKFV